MVRMLVITFLASASVSSAQAQNTPSPSDVLGKLEDCAQISTGKYATDVGRVRTIPVCERGPAVHWKADLDIDCDGERTAECNRRTDPSYQPDTALHTEAGRPLNAAITPYVVVPSPSDIWDYRTAHIRLGACAAAVWNGRIVYGVLGDAGPRTIIGEASYAMAKALGINSDPRNGGWGGVDVTYIVFPRTKVTPVDSAHAARDCGEKHMIELLRVP